MELETPTDRIEGVLVDLVRPAGYVSWEYLARQRLLARGIAAFRGTGARVLDIGCGGGTLSITLSESTGMDVVGMDVLGARVAGVRDRKAARNPRAAGHVGLVVANAEALPFRSDSFDAVVATEVLEHLDEPERMLAEARRVLRPGGRFFMTTPNARALPYRILRFFPDETVKRLAASWVQESLHPELLHHDATSGPARHPDRHRREGFTLREIRALGVRVGFRMGAGYTYRIPLPDRVMGRTPRRLSRALAGLGTHPLPLGLQLYAEFAKA